MRRFIFLLIVVTAFFAKANAQTSVTFQYNQENKCGNVLFSATILNDTIPHSVIWTLGDGATATTMDVTHKYFGNDTTYIVNLKVYEKDSMLAEKTDTIKVYPSPDANFKFTNYPEKDSLKLEFADGQPKEIEISNFSISTTSNSKFTFDWGDTLVDTYYDPFQLYFKHSYKVNGFYKVIIKVENKFGCESIKELYVTISDKPLPVSINFVYQQDNKCGSVLFNAKVNNNPLNSTINWNLGDGSTANIIDVTHKYVGNDTTYIVSVQVLNNAVILAEKTDTIKVYPSPDANFKFTNYPEKDSLKLEFADGQPKEIEISNFSITTTSNSKFTFDWGDTLVDTYYDPFQLYFKHSYKVKGFYKVIIKVENKFGCESIKELYVTISDKPLPATIGFRYQQDNKCGNVNYVAEIWNYNLPFDLKWDLGDGTITSFLNPHHQYTGNDTTYIVSVQLLNNTVVIAEKKDTVHAYPSPDAGFKFIASMGKDTLIGCIDNNKVDIYNNSLTKASNVKYIINWGDSKIDTTYAVNDSVFSHNYAATGAYNISIIVLNKFGCEGFKDLFVKFSDKPMIAITKTGNTEGCSPVLVKYILSGFENNTSDTKYTVSYGDDSPDFVIDTVKADTLKHNYVVSSCAANQNNSFTLKVTAENSCGKAEAMIENIKVTTKPEADFTLSPLSKVCIDNILSLVNISRSCCTDTTATNTKVTSKWVITPDTGWVVVNGDINVDANIELRFSKTDNYNIKLYTSNPCCGESFSEKTIEVLSTPVISGKVYSNSVAVTSAKVKLYVYSNNRMSVVMDSMNVTNDGSYKFVNVPKGDYIIYVATDTINYPGTLGTYYGDQVGWVNANIVKIEDCASSLENANINIYHSTAITGGDGSISGNIDQILFNHIIINKPMKGVKVQLEVLPNTKAGKVIETYTDAKGAYAFSSLPLGRYLINVEITGLKMDTVPLVQITPADIAQYYDFTVDSAKISPVSFSIEGSVKYDNKYGNPISDVTLRLQNLEGKTYNIVSTNKDGYYKFNNVINGVYKIVGSCSKAIGGVDPGDALSINRNYIGLYKFKDNLMAAVADVSNDSVVNPLDALTVNRRYIDKINSFPSGDWLFEKVQVKVDNTYMILNFKGICFGDVDASNILYNKSNNSNINLQYQGTIESAKNSVINIPFSFDQSYNIGALGLVIKYDNSNMEVRNITSSITGLIYNVTNNEIRIAWSANNNYGVNILKNQAFLNIEARIMNDNSLFSLGSESVLVDNNNETISGATIIAPKLTLASGISSVNNDVKFAVSPNPCRDKATIYYSLNNKENVRVALYDILGNEITVLSEGVQAAGNYKVDFNTANLVKGIYIYKIQRGSDEFAGKLVKVD